MKLSTRSTYGLRALVELGLTVGRGPVSASAIATSQDLSVAYLEQLLHRLKKQGVVISIRGPKGGYLLAKEPEQISIGEIVRVLDGPSATANGGLRNGHLPACPPTGIRGRRAPHDKAGQAGAHAQRIAHAVFRGVHERLANALETVTLQDLCDEVREEAGEPLEHRYVFHI